MDFINVWREGYKPSAASGIVDFGTVISWYAQHVSAPLAQAVQHVQDLSPVPLDDLMVGAVATCAGAAAWRILRARNPTERVRRLTQAIAVTGAITAYGFTASAPAFRDPFIDRHHIGTAQIGLEEHQRAFTRHQDTALVLERDAGASAIIVPDDVVCAQVLRVTAALGEPVIRTPCAPLTSITFRTAQATDGTLGMFNPFSRTMSLGVPSHNYWRPWYLAHEMAHAQLFQREDEAQFIAYLSLATAQGEYAAPMRQIAHLMRAHDESIALHERAGIKQRLVMPPRAYEDFQAIVERRPSDRQSAPPTPGEIRSIEEAIGSAPVRVGQYDLGFLLIAHAWERTHGPELPTTRSPVIPGL